MRIEILGSGHRDIVLGARFYDQQLTTDSTHTLRVAHRPRGCCFGTECPTLGASFALSFEHSNISQHSIVSRQGATDDLNKMNRNKEMNKMTKMIVTGLMLVSGLIAAPAKAATPDYLSFTAVGGDVTIGMKKFGKPAAVTFETSSNSNAETWETFAAGTTTIALANGETVYFRRQLATATTVLNQANDCWIFTLSGSGLIDAGGSVVSLIDKLCLQSTLGPYAFKYLFKDCTRLRKPPALPMATLEQYCYTYMFSGCTSLTEAPELSHVTTVAYGCCYYMFSGCNVLTNATVPSASALAKTCYSSMYNGCKELPEVPDLSHVTTVAEECCRGMFNGCSVLTNATVPSATELAKGCYYDMYKGCAKLPEAPELSHVTTVAESCCYRMFNGCSVLTNATVPTAWALSNSCYYDMYGSCKKLPEAPELSHVTTVAEDCCQAMFSGCSVLMNAPVPSATELAKGCYFSMYKDCKKLPEAPELSHVTTVAEECCEGMFNGCSVLTNATVPSATALAKDCYYDMYNGCKKLLAAPELSHVTAVAEGCCRYMFSECSVLTNATVPSATELAKDCYRRMYYRNPKLPSAPELSQVTTVAESCCYQMFDGCTLLRNGSLPSASTLEKTCYYSMYNSCPRVLEALDLSHVTAVAEGCCQKMFSGCGFALTNASLPAVMTLVPNCYDNMFYGCDKLNRIEVPFTDWDAEEYATTNWVYNLPTTGTFVAPADLDTSVKSAHRVPFDWGILALGSKDAPWKVGTIGPEVIAWTNGLGEIIFEGAGTVDTLSARIPSLAAVAAGVDEITVKPGVTNAVANAYAGFGTPADPVELNTLPDDWAGSEADPETGRWYAAYTKSAVQKELEEAIEPNGTVKPVPDADGNPTNFVITITADIVPGPVVVPDDVGDVIIDLAGHTVSGTNGVNGTTGSAGTAGGPAIVVPGGATVKVIDSKGGGVVTGGKGGNGNPPGEGGSAIVGAATLVDEHVIVKKGGPGELLLPTIRLIRVQQRYPWNGMVDIDYTVADVPEPANYFVKFTATTGAGVKYVAHEMLDASTLINASNGTYRVTWVASAEGATFQDCAEFFTKNAKYKAELVYSGSDKSQIPYPYYVVIDVSGGAAATSYPVAYEYFANTHLATNKYNTAEYKTDKIVLRKIHACTFIMGSPEDEVGRESQTSANNNKETQHEVTLSDDYYVGMFPITQQQWLKVVGGDNPATSGGDDADICPVEGVSYRDIRGSSKGINLSLLSKGSVDANSFIGILRDKSGLTDLDLPSEAQWENAARAGTKTSTFFGNNVTNNMTGAEIGKYMWHSGVSGTQTHGVGQVIPNQWGLYDVLGNVLEICLDLVATAPNDDWGTDPVTDPLRAAADSKVIVRGGYYSGDAIRARSAARDSQPATTGKNRYRGFRLAMHAPIKQQPGAVQLWENGPYWATYNVGATKPEEYGYYFWWGDTVGATQKVDKTGFVSVKDGSTTIMFNESDPAGSTFGKSIEQLYNEGYIDDNSADEKLKPEYDAARKYLKGDWRMPTSAEMQALIDNCDWKWTTLNGVTGYAVTGKGDYASKGIFLPAAGFGSGSSLSSSGSKGFYWPSTPNSDSNYAWSLYFYSSRFERNYGNRYLGYSVRPVR